MHTVAQDRIQLDMDLSNALAAEQFFLVYQPMLSLENERVVGVEALLRWLHPTRGVIPPDLFIPIAEDNGLIISIGRWVLEQACAQAAAWHLANHMTWEQLTDKKTHHLLGGDEIYFSAADIRAAMQIADRAIKLADARESDSKSKPSAGTTAESSGK